MILKKAFSLAEVLITLAILGVPETYYLYTQYCSETSTSDLNGAACTFKYITKY